ncbi:MAG: FtsX-like permease family protein [Cyclobacteriaceae bacterium]|nr:FtsX-like permease family protein [Cyclobacteriaceae bacterium]
MIKNYLVLFIRNLERQRLFSFINLLGLTVSIASTMLIYLYIRHEFSYDGFHKDVDRIYRVNQTFIWGDGDNHQFSSTGPGVAMALKEELPEMELLTSIHTPGNFVVSYTDAANEVIAFEEERVLAADTNFFKMFSFPLIQGDANSALRQTNTLVMTESTAKKYFNDENPIGKLVRLGKADNQKTYEVTGVVKDTPENSYIEFDILLSMEGFGLEKRHWSWIWTQLETYIKVAPGTNIENTKAKLALIPRKHAETSIRAAMNMSYDEYVKSGKKWELFLQPMTSIHLPEEIVYNRLNDSGNIKILYSLMGAVAFIVLLSCVNFMNLSTAQFTRRIKEASIRKIMGLGRAQLSFNYLLEALIFCGIALFISLGIAQLLLPGFNAIVGKSLQMNLFSDPVLMIALISLILFMALISGSYPAIFLSAFNPVEAMKGKMKTGGGKAFRNGLVIFQFSVSIVLILCTSVVFQQLKFVSETDLGFNKENLMVIEHVENVGDGEAFAKAALNIPGVVSSSWCTSVPPTIFGGDSFTAEGTNQKTLPLNFTTGDENYIPTLGIKMKVGRNFQADIPGDVKRLILNETAVREIGWNVDESVIGKRITKPGENDVYEIAGVVEDFHYWSLESPIEPMAIFHIKSPVLGAGNTKYVTLRIGAQSAEEWESTMAAAEKLWKTHANGLPFQYSFIDQKFADSFRTQQQFAKTLTVMATLAILIAALGLLGMIIYTLEQKTKEIGIRKVSGASVWNILTLISRGYTHLIVIAFIIGAPLSYWMMTQWLQDFAYRVPISLWIFAWTGVGTLMVAIVITSYHSVKAALTNPVTVLRDE